MARLQKEGRLQEPGRAAFAARTESRSRVYSFERRDEAVLTPAQERLFKKDRKAWAFFQGTAPWYRRTCTHWVVSAKQEETRLRRLQQLIEACGRGEAIGPLKGKLPKAKAQR
jgi:uncharacterized protein YdeI (YjbR/CyaY-like superfamily)